jgi:hypothetical protein
MSPSAALLIINPDHVECPQPAFSKRAHRMLDRMNARVSGNVVPGSSGDDGEPGLGSLTVHDPRHYVSHRAVSTDGGELIIAFGREGDLSGVSGPLSDNRVFGIDRVAPP